MNDPNRKSTPEELNERMLKNAALTFSLEGISRDLKAFINKKVYYNTNSLRSVSEIIDSITRCGNKRVKEALLNKTSVTSKMYQHVFDEMRVTNLTLNFIIQKIMERERSIVTSKPESADN